VGDRLTFTIEVIHNAEIGDGSLVSDLTVIDSTGRSATYRSGDRNTDTKFGNGESWTFEFPYTISETEADPIELTFTVLGQDLDGDIIQVEVTSQVDVEHSPFLKLDVAGPNSTQAGDQISYKVSVINDTNRGDGSSIHKLKMVGLGDESIPYISGDTNTNDQLDIGETWLYEVSYKVQSDFPPLISLPFIITGFDQDDDPLEFETSYPLDIDFNPAIAILLTTPDKINFNEQVNVEITLSNDMTIGDGSPISNVNLSDSVQEAIVYSEGDSDSDSILDAGENWLFNLNLTTPLVDSPILDRELVATGIDQNGDLIRSTKDYSIGLDYNPALRILAAGPASAQIGETVTAIITITLDSENGDGSPVNHIEVSDNLSGRITYLSGDDGDQLLEDGEGWIFTSSFTIPESDSLTVESVLTTTGNDLDGESIQGSFNLQLQRFFVFSNGDFELFDQGWEFLDQGLMAGIIQSTLLGDRVIPLGSYSALLGEPDLPCSPEGIPLGYAELKRILTVPEVDPGRNVGLKFNYIIYSQDTSTKPDYDRFEVFINDNSTPVFSDGNLVNEGLGCNVWWRVPGPRNIRDDQISGWATGFIDLDRFQGQTIQISFQNHNRYDGWYNTLTYLDNIEIVMTE
jgi:hypothetical protein